MKQGLALSRGSVLQSTLGRTVRFVLGFIAGGVLFYFASRGLELANAWAVIRELRWGYLTAAVVLVLISPLVRAWRWRGLFENETPSVAALMKAVVTGQTLNYALPFRSGEVARVFMVGKRKLPVAGTIAVEKFLDIAFFAVLCLFLPLVWVVPEWLEGPRLSVLVMAVVYLLVVLAVSWLVPQRNSTSRIVWIPPLEKMPLLLGTSLFLWLSSVYVNFFLLRALRVEAPFLAALVLLVIIQAGVAVPSTPGKIGVFQYLAILGLSLFGVSKAAALAFGLVLHLVIFVPVALMTAIFFLIDRRRGAGDA